MERKKERWKERKRDGKKERSLVECSFHEPGLSWWRHMHLCQILRLWLGPTAGETWTLWLQSAWNFLHWSQRVQWLFSLKSKGSMMFLHKNQCFSIFSKLGIFWFLKFFDQIKVLARWFIWKKNWRYSKPRFLANSHQRCYGLKSLNSMITELKNPNSLESLDSITICWIEMVDFNEFLRFSWPSPMNKSKILSHLFY